MNLPLFWLNITLSIHNSLNLHNEEIWGKSSLGNPLLLLTMAKKEKPKVFDTGDLIVYQVVKCNSPGKHTLVLKNKKNLVRFFVFKSHLRRWILWCEENIQLAYIMLVVLLWWPLGAEKRDTEGPLEKSPYDI